LFNSIALLVIFYRRYGTFGLGEIARSVAKFAVASSALGVVAYVMIHWPGLYQGATSQKIAALGVTITAAGATYLAVAYLLRAQELSELRLIGRARTTEYV
jgi:peptidoglycan biosynthesis protein MviN/MurJ (putative lipid II flippase)